MTRDECSEHDDGIDRHTPEYARGRADFALGKNVMSNPYRAGYYYDRLNWYAGWYDARTAHNLRHVFQRHGIVFP